MAQSEDFERTGDRAEQTRIPNPESRIQSPIAKEPVCSGTEQAGSDRTIRINNCCGYTNCVIYSDLLSLSRHQLLLIESLDVRSKIEELRNWDDVFLASQMPQSLNSSIQASGEKQPVIISARQVVLDDAIRIVQSYVLYNIIKQYKIFRYCKKFTISYGLSTFLILTYRLVRLNNSILLFALKRAVPTA